MHDIVVCTFCFHGPTPNAATTLCKIVASLAGIPRRNFVILKRSFSLLSIVIVGISIVERKNVLNETHQSTECLLVFPANKWQSLLLSAPYLHHLHAFRKKHTFSRSIPIIALYKCLSHNYSF